MGWGVGGGGVGCRPYSICPLHMIIITIGINIFTLKVVQVNRQAVNAVEDTDATPQGLCAHTTNQVHIYVNTMYTIHIYLVCTFR